VIFDGFTSDEIDREVNRKEIVGQLVDSGQAGLNPVGGEQELWRRSGVVPSKRQFRS
jgi:hypothetical protein